MPRMTYLSIQTRTKKLVNVTGTGFDNLVKDAIQWGLDIISSAWNWIHLMEETFITTVAPYTDGTVTVINGDATVTGLSTVFTAAMVGRKIRFANQEAYYRIASRASDTEIELEVPFQGTGDSGLSFSIFKDEYRLPNNLDKLKTMRQIEEGIAMISLSPPFFDLAEPTPNSEGSPNFNIIIGTKRDTYSTGTLEISSHTVTGSATTAWTSVDGLGNGNRITVGTNVYTIKSVDSATSITIYETATVSAGTSYSILMDNLIVQFFDIPDAEENIYFRFQRMAEVLFNDTDIPDLPEQYHWVLVLFSEAFLWKSKDKTESKLVRAEAFAGLELMKTQYGHISQNTVYPRRSIADTMGRNLPLGPRSTGNRGAPFSL